MEGNIIKIWSMLLAALIVWTGVQFHLTGSSKVGAPNYPQVSFDTQDADELTYGTMINSLRQLLTDGTYDNGIPVLRNPANVPDSERYILLEITTFRNQSVTFAIDVTNVYIIGYRVGDSRYFFEEAPSNAEQFLFTDITVPVPTRRSSNYQRLEGRARASRRSITLGLNTLADAIATLCSRPEDPRSIIIVLQMISESVRYWEIETRVRRSSSFFPDSYTIDLENNWGALSEQIQISDNFGFERAITIDNMEVDNINSYVIAGLYLMMFICAPRVVSLKPHPQLLLVETTYLQLMRSDLEGADTCKYSTDPRGRTRGRNELYVDVENFTYTDKRSDLEVPDTCKHSLDPRARIRGRNGLCIDVENFTYRDKNPIVLSSCRTNDFKNQLWTITNDGRVISLEKCLAAAGTTPGSSVIKHECDTLDESAVQWAMLYSGTLANKHSGLVLTATDGSDGSKLTLETDSASSFQAWKHTNNLNEVNVYIQGENNQCIYYNGKYGVYTEACSKGLSRQMWRLYPDSTVRPKDWLDGCLELERLSGDWIYVQAGYCCSSPELHRWIFAHDGSIMNWKTKLVVDASKIYPGWLYAWPFHGGQNQIWTLEFIQIMYVSASQYTAE